MGLSASQARFLQLTARKSNIEYEAQRINFERLQLSDKASLASTKYQDAMNNRHMVLSYNDGTGAKEVIVSYSNYKSYMNQQMEGLSTSLEKYYLVSSSGNKIVVDSEAERDRMIEENTTRTPVSDVLSAQKAQDDANSIKTQIEEAQKNNETTDLTIPTLSQEQQKLAKIDLNKVTTVLETDENGNEIEYIIDCPFKKEDFLIADDLDNVDNFQKAIQDGVYYFAKFAENSVTGKKELRTEGWDVLGGGAISEQYDKTDDAAAEAEYSATQDKIQAIDKKLELRLDQLESERSAIQTEMDSVKKVVDDNIEKSFNTFS